MYQDCRWVCEFELTSFVLGGQPRGYLIATPRDRASCSGCEGGADAAWCELRLKEQWLFFRQFEGKPGGQQFRRGGVFVIDEDCPAYNGGVGWLDSLLHDRRLTRVRTSE